MSKFTFRKYAFISLLAVAALGSASATNLLANPGFETGDFTGWTVLSVGANGVATYATPESAYFPGYVNVRTGSYAGFGLVRGNCCTAPEAITLTQVLTVAPNQIFDIGFYASNWSSSGVGAGIGNAPNLIEIYVNGTPILTPVNYFLFNNDQSWYNFAGTFSNGAATSLTVTYQFIASGTGNFPASLDDFYVNSTVPEPSSLLLMGSGLAGLAGFLRRKLS